MDLCDFPDIDVDGTDNDKNGETAVNPHSYGTEEWQKVEEEKLKTQWENRLNAQKEHHLNLNKIWQENYEKAQKHIKEDLLIEELSCDPDKKEEKKKISCNPPKLEAKPLEKNCEVKEYKECVKKELYKRYEDQPKKS